MWVRVFLFVMAVGWTPYGIFCLLFPEALAGIAGIEPTHPSAVTELRAMYGGMQIAIGLSALLGFFRVVSIDKALFVQLVAIGGLGSARLIGAVFTSDWSVYTGGALTVEWIVLAIIIVAMRSPSSAQ